MTLRPTTIMRTKNMINSLYLKQKSDVKEVDKGWISRKKVSKTPGQKKEDVLTQSSRYMGAESKKLKFQVVTYNVAELTKPDGADLTPILALQDKPDVIAIG